MQDTRGGRRCRGAHVTRAWSRRGAPRGSCLAVRCQVRGVKIKERPSEFMYMVREQIRYTVGHLLRDLAMAEGGWHAHGSRYPRTLPLVLLQL
jgi:hypothetical protein